MSGGYELKFLDGPASSEKVHTVVPPTKRRWFCVRQLEGETVFSWWVFDEKPPADPDITITEYVMVGSAPRADGSALVTYGMKEADDGDDGAQA